MSEFIKQGDTVRLLFPTRDPSTGASVDAAALPACTIYKDGFSIGTAGSTVTNKSTGLYEVAIVCTSGNGYTIGSDFSVAISCTVNPAVGTPTFGVGCIADFRITARDIDDVATSAAIAVIQADTDDIQARLPAALVSGRMDSSVGSMAAETLTSAALASSAVTELQTGLATSASVSSLATIAQVANVQISASDIQTRLPAALVSGRIDASIGAAAANSITAASIATDAIDADALAASALAEVAAAVWSQVLESTFTAADMFRGAVSVLFGKVTDFSTGTLVFRNLLDTKNRITVATGATGRTTSTVNDLT